MAVSKLDDFETVEQVFHDKVWRVANDARGVENAIREARGIMYVVLASVPEGESTKHNTLRELVDEWLKHYGRSSMQEPRAYLEAIEEARREADIGH